MKAETMAAWVAILAVAEMVAVAEGAKEAAMVVAVEKAAVALAVVATVVVAVVELVAAETTAAEMAAARDNLHSEPPAVILVVTAHTVRDPESRYRLGPCERCDKKMRETRFLKGGGK